jgi:hypothetical protein
LSPISKPGLRILGKSGSFAVIAAGLVSMSKRLFHMPGNLLAALRVPLFYPVRV